MVSTIHLAITLVGWVAAVVFGVQNYNLHREVEELKKQLERREREARLKHKTLESVLVGLGNIISQTEAISNARAKVDEIWRRAEAEALEELKNEPPLKP